jgi:hypothetical protein
MSKTRSYAVVAILVAAAIITPTPDMITLSLMALPMYLLYELCIWLAWFDRKKSREREAEDAEEYRLRQLAWMDREYEEQLAKDHEGMEGYDSEKNGTDHSDSQMEGDWHAPGYDEYHDEYQDHYGRYHDDEDDDEDDDPHHHGMPEDEDWDHPDDAIVGDPEKDQDIPESGDAEKKPESSEKKPKDDPKQDPETDKPEGDNPS